MTRKMMPTPAQRRVLEWTRDLGYFPPGTMSATIQACYRAGWIMRDGPLEITPLGRDALAQVEGRVG